MLLSMLASRVRLPHTSKLCHAHSVVNNGDDTPVPLVSAAMMNATENSSDSSDGQWSAEESGLLRVWIALQTVVCGRSDVDQQIINKRLHSADNIHLSQ